MELAVLGADIDEVAAHHRRGPRVGAELARPERRGGGGRVADRVAHAARVSFRRSAGDEARAAFSRDGRVLLSGSDDNTCKLWDVRQDSVADRD